jgi:phosphoribosylanthranilate isomerase
VFDSVVRVKICGLTRVDEALACARLGAEWIGVNFHPASPRYVRPAIAAKIVAALSGSAAAVGVFVDRPAAEVAAVSERIGLQIIQLHGNEPPDDLISLDRFRIIRAFRLSSASAWQGVHEYLDRAKVLGRSPDAVLIDAYRAGQAGGTGVAISEPILDQAPLMPRLILAGGLTPGNVAAKVARLRPWMVDVASGVEASPGRKDLGLVASFIAAVKSASEYCTDNPRTPNQ